VCVGVRCDSYKNSEVLEEEWEESDQAVGYREVQCVGGLGLAMSCRDWGLARRGFGSGRGRCWVGSGAREEDGSLWPLKPFNEYADCEG